MRNLMWASLAALCLLAGGGVASADDTVRLGGPSAQNDIQAGTDVVRGHGGYGGRGGYGGGYGRGGYYGGGYGRGGYYGGGYGRGGYYAGYGWGGYGWGGGYYPYSSYYYPYPVYQPYYYSPYYYNSYYYPIVGKSAPIVTLQQANYYAPPPANTQLQPGQLYGEPVPLSGGNGTFPYDGGPRSPIPMPAPGADLNPANDRGIIPLDGKLVSFPQQATGGFSPVGLPPVQPRSSTTTTATPTPTTKTAPATKTAPLPRVSYPAYGEMPR